MTVSHTKGVVATDGVSTASYVRVSIPTKVSEEGAAYVLDALKAAGTQAATNTRASAQTVTDHDGIYRQARNHELCCNGLRRNENLLGRSAANPGSEVSGAAIPASWTWTADSATIGAASFGTFATSGAEYVQYVITNTSGSTRYPAFSFVSSATSISALAGEKIAWRMLAAVTASSGGALATVQHYGNTSGGAYVNEVSTTWSTSNQTLAENTYASGTPQAVAGATVAYLTPVLRVTIPNGASITIRIAKVHFQKVHGASNLVCGEYVNAATVHNAVVAGVRYSATTNGNSVSSGVLVEANGTAISNTWTGISLPQTQINYKTYSEDLDAVDWTLTNATAFDDGTLGPDAVGQLQKFTDNAINAEHSLYGAASGATAGTMHTKCFHVKAGTIYGLRLRVGSGPDYGMAEFRLSDMTIVGTFSGGTGTFRNAWIERVGLTDIYRIIVCATFSSSIIGQAKAYLAQSAGVTSYVGTSQYCYIGFTDFLIGHDSPGPYIANKATGTTTRAVNAPSGNLPGVFASNGNMTMVIKFKPFYHTPATWKQDWYDSFRVGSIPDLVKSFYADKTGSSYVAHKVVSSAGSTVNGPAGAQVRLQQVGVVSGLVNNVHKMSVDGTAVVTSANSTACPMAATWSCDDIHGLVQRVEFWPRAMSDAEMQARSTP